MPSKTDLYRELKSLRKQLTNLEKKCQEREDQVVKVLLAIEPFLPALSAEAQKCIQCELQWEDN